MKNLFANLQSWKGPAAVAAYGALILVAIVLTWSSLAGIAEQRDSVAGAESMLAQLEGRSLSHKDDGSPLAGAPSGSAFLEGQSLNVAGAALLQRIATAVQRLGGNVVSSQVDLDNERAKEGWIDLIVSCDIDQPGLQQLLYDVESGMPFLFIDQLSVQAPASGSEAARAENPRMRVLMTVSGQWWNNK